MFGCMNKGKQGIMDKVQVWRLGNWWRMLILITTIIHLRIGDEKKQPSQIIYIYNFIYSYINYIHNIFVTLTITNYSYI